jgi:hypothetical protein
MKTIRKPVEYADFLPNGARVLGLAYIGDGRNIVLASFHGDYVTWNCDEDGNASRGHYFSELGKAEVDFQKRITEKV